MTRADLVDLAKLKQHGYALERYTGTGGGWMLLDPDGGHLMIGDHGCLAPTQWEAVAEGLSRIAQDERCERAAEDARRERAANARHFKVVLTEAQHDALESAARACIERLALEDLDALREALSALLNAEEIR